MIKKGLIDKIHEAASIERWNDYVRPIKFTELSKQAHKMAIAYVIAKFEEQDKQVKIDWHKIIQGGIFEFLHRVMLTDIKPPVFHRMMKTKGKELNAWVLKNLDSDLKEVNFNFLENFKLYFYERDYAYTEKRILKAAHYLATNWEFKIIYHSCPNIYGIENTRQEIENEIEDHFDIIGVQKISLGKKSFGFVDLCGQLRFQKRWANSPRIPKTDVLGHMLIVAFLSYFCSAENNACEKRVYNNFFCALFHDLPEVLTRDIISPIKSSVEGLDEIIHEYELLQLEQKILPLIPYSWHKEINYFLNDQFQNKIIEEGKIVKGLSNDDMENKYNKDIFSPIDGEIIRACDHFSAFIEASISIAHGIKSHHLIDARKQLYERYKNKQISNINFGQLFDFFTDEAT
ncbi:MAG: HD domain-containing protein [Desulfobacterales bacterium]|nr:HD domain-containing protein [Desulfobacterales bacterium]MBF0395414.1 HD domain-containing protein [Desulfobacterales bacterium]